MLESFEQNVWAMRFRCMSCHIEGTAENEKLVKEHGRARGVVQEGRRRGDDELSRQRDEVDRRDESREKSAAAQAVGRGQTRRRQEVPARRSRLQAFRSWIEDYVAVKNGTYTKANDLPKPVSKQARFGSDIWLKLSETPPEWGDKLLQVSVYAWDDTKKAWDTEPIAQSDRGVWGKGKQWQHNLTLLAAKESELAKKWKREKPCCPPASIS